MKELTYIELLKLPADSYTLVDVRDSVRVQYGTIPGAINIPEEEIKNKIEHYATTLSPEKSLVLFCQSGIHTIALADAFEAMGRDVYSLKEGYVSYLIYIIENEKNLERQHKAELSISKKFHTELFTPFAKACREYRLIEEGDHIAVCISGGKDSMLMAKLFQEIQRHKKMEFKLTFLVMDPGYNSENRALIEHNARILGVPITIFNTRIFDAVDKVDKYPCYLCARMRRGYLYSKAKELVCNKIALGHHYDDVIETTLMSMLHSGQIQTMMPKLKSLNYEGMELIRPLYLVREKDICRWRDYNELHFLQCACHFTDTCTTCHEDGTTSSKRLETKKLIAELKKSNPLVESHIFNSMSNVNVDAVIEYKKNDVRHNFLEEY